MLSVDIKKSFGEFNLNVKFQVKEGSITAIFGKSGSGKTSIINTIAGLLMPDKGLIKIKDKILFEQKKGTNLPIHKRKIGFVFQDDRLFPHLNVRKNLTYGISKDQNFSEQLSFEKIIELLELESLLDRMPISLSGGEKQRISIGRALLSCPELLIMDEPLASIDFQHRAEILPFIKMIRDLLGITIIYVTHVKDEVIFLADHLLLLNSGQIIAQGSVEKIFSRIDLNLINNRNDSGSVISATFREYDERLHLGELSFEGGTLRIPGFKGIPQESMRAHILARDVSIMLTKPDKTSVLNIFGGVIDECGEENGPQIDLLINIGVPLKARITKKSFEDLDLAVGSRVFAMVKAVAVNRQILE